MKIENECGMTVGDRISLVRSDLNLEKWCIFTTRMKKGYRVLQRDVTLPDGSVQTQVVRIGLAGATESLTAEHALIFYAVLDLWEVQGRPEDGIVRTTYGHLLNRLIQKGETRRGKWSKEWLREKLSTMRRVPIEFSFFSRKDGSPEMNVPLTLFSDCILWDRRGAKERMRSGLSYITIHPKIVRNLLEYHVKPIRFDVLVTLKKDISRILYRYFDLMLFGQTAMEREITGLAAELEIGATRLDNLLTQFRAASSELAGKDVSSGRIEVCRVERTADGAAWKIIVKKGKRTVLTAPGRPAGAADEGEMELAAAIKRETELMDYYEATSDDDRQAIERRRMEIIKSNYGGWVSDFSVKMARLDAIEEFKNQINSACLATVSS